ncbi:MAG: DUF3576 domain-containing protein [Alphaproteobacteria bacterium]|nr:DUF3576 domain-containing protein [Alphaproteobacteria bacterium]
MKKSISLFLFPVLALFAFGLAGCSGNKIQSEAKYPSGADRPSTGGDIYSKPKSIFGAGGLSFGGKRKEGEGDGSTGIGVNSFLWRASLDTVSFMPLASADPFGGVILTDWYSPDSAKKERYKLNVFILNRQLRSDGIEVRVYKQINQTGTWFDTAPAPEMARQLEDTILTRARQLRLSQNGGDN